MRVPAPWQAARALRAEVRWAPAPALLQDPLGGPGHLTTVQTHGTVPSKPCHEHMEEKHVAPSHTSRCQRLTQTSEQHLPLLLGILRTGAK